MAAPAVIACTNCGTKNRVPVAGEGTPRCAVCHSPLPWIVSADADSFESALEAAMPVLVDFWAPWCQPCHMVSPVVERLGRENAGRLKVVKLDVDTAPEIAARYAVQGIPLLVLIRDGHEIDRQVGAVPAPQLRTWLDGHLATAKQS
jgi:thioredoxin 2